MEVDFWGVKSSGCEKSHATKVKCSNIPQKSYISFQISLPEVLNQKLFARKLVKPQNRKIARLFFERNFLEDPSQRKPFVGNYFDGTDKEFSNFFLIIEIFARKFTIDNEYKFGGFWPKMAIFKESAPAFHFHRIQN
jgi:hypothetical protein